MNKKIHVYLLASSLAMCSFASFANEEPNKPKEIAPDSQEIIERSKDLPASRDLEADREISRKIASVNRETDLLKARIDYEKLKQELITLGGDTRMGGTMPAPSIGVQPPPELLAPNEGGEDQFQPAERLAKEHSALDLPRLVMVYGSRTRGYWAQLRMGNGLVQDVRTGEVIDGGYKVSAISTQGVSLEDASGKTWRLSSYAAPLKK